MIEINPHRNTAPVQGVLPTGTLAYRKLKAYPATASYRTCFENLFEFKAHSLQSVLTRVTPGQPCDPKGKKIRPMSGTHEPSLANKAFALTTFSGCQKFTTQRAGISKNYFANVDPVIAACVVVRTGMFLPCEKRYVR